MQKPLEFDPLKPTTRDTVRILVTTHIKVNVIVTCSYNQRL